VMAAMRETVSRIQEALMRAGVDLERLKAQARALPENWADDPDVGAKLLAQCRRAGGMAPVGDCLPAMGDSDG